jgi:hypothetical protein
MAERISGGAVFGDQGFEESFGELVTVCDEFNGSPVAGIADCDATRIL